MQLYAARHESRRTERAPASSGQELEGGAHTAFAPVTIECPHSARCPGCGLIGSPLGEQLDAKALRLASAFVPYGMDGAPTPEHVRAAEPTSAYRTRAKLSVATGGRLGLYAAQSHEVIDLPECQVLAPVLASAASAIRTLLAAPPPAAASLLQGVPDDLALEDLGPERGTTLTGRLRAIDLREVRDEADVGVLLTLVVVDAPVPAAPELEAACDALEVAIPELRAIALSLHDGRSPQLLGRTPVTLRGTPLQRDRSSPNEPYSYASPGSFAQAHRDQAAAIAGHVLRVLAPRPDQRILELFAGSGALALALARRGCVVTLVESFAPAAHAAMRAADEQSLDSRMFARVGAAERIVPRLAAEGAQFEAAVVNPPRRGVAPSARDALARICTGPLVYISCEPETLARDLSHFAQLGWQNIRLTPFDMMPQTREVECVAVLERRDLPPPTVIYEDAELIAIAKPPFLHTALQQDCEDSLLARVRRNDPAAVPLYALDRETSGVCLFAKNPRFVSAWSAALAGPNARTEYLALVRGHARAKGRIARALFDGGREQAAVTRYRKIESLGGHSLLEVTPEQDRKDQIRRHTAGLGRPVLGDDRYGHAASNRHLAERYWLDRTFLHLSGIALMHPQTGARLQVEAPLSPDLACVLERLRESRRTANDSVPRRESRRVKSPRAKPSGF